MSIKHRPEPMTPEKIAQLYAAMGTVFDMDAFARAVADTRDATWDELFSAYRDGSEEAFGVVVEQKRAAEKRCAELQETIFAQQRVIANLQAGRAAA